jgi:katanin p60 ATPase-containing subunit A1
MLVRRLIREISKTRWRSREAQWYTLPIIKNKKK